MGLRIQNNVEAFNAHRQLTGTAAKAAKAMEKLSSGYRVNRAADDAAGLAISEKMRAQIGGLAQAQRNAQDAVSLVQTGEGALNEVHSMLQRVRDLKVQYDAGTLSTEDKKAIVAEVAQLGKEVGDIANKTEFNGLKLLNGGSFTFTVGANSADTVSLTTATPRALPSTRSRSRTSTPPSRTCRPPVRRSVPCRTVSSTVSPTSRPTRRTWWRRRAGSATWTWPRRWSTSRSSRSCSRPARACSRRPTRPRRAFSRSCARPYIAPPRDGSMAGGSSGPPVVVKGPRGAADQPV